jgi:hypothetical protein
MADTSYIVIARPHAKLPVMPVWGPYELSAPVNFDQVVLLRRLANGRSPNGESAEDQEIPLIAPPCVPK